MDGDSCGDHDNIDWHSEDEREIENYVLSRSSSSTLPSGEAMTSTGEASSSVGSGSKLIDHFVGMGFPEKNVVEVIQESGEENADLVLETLLKHSVKSSASSSGSKLINHFVRMGFDIEMVAKAIDENGEENTDTILETLLTYTAIENSPQEDPHMESDESSTGLSDSFFKDFSDLDNSEDEENAVKSEPDQESTLFKLTRMGYAVDEASIALDRCGPNASIEVVIDFVCAAQAAKVADTSFLEEKPKTRRHVDADYLRSHDMQKRKKQTRLDKMSLPGDDEIIRPPKPMVGFGVPNRPDILTHKKLPQAAIGPPYFYYENVALAPKGVWNTISECLYGIEPEFVDSKFFCAAARKRGYVHNLPIKNRNPLFPLPPSTIHEALPLTRRWWPSWDRRTKLNCLQTCVGSAKLTERIRKALEDHEGDPPPHVQDYVLGECRKWNLVWVGRKKAAPLEPDELEMLLGFPRNHTRGGGLSRTDRYKSLGNSFQVDTVAYHLSVLKDMFPGGINLLSLFSGIGGAEVALHRIGIRLKNVVTVEISEGNRNVMRCWWEQTNQTGNLIDIADVQDLHADRLEQLMSSFGGFDLLVGGSPCNNLTGSNRHHRDGLEGKESSLFFDYCRILDSVKSMMAKS